jgi:hypothetical protein
MSERDSDFEFDFFEDLEPSEQTEERTRIVRRPGGGPPRRPPRPPAGAVPLFRLAGLIAFAILIIVLLVFWVKSCQSSGKKATYKHYFEKIAVIAGDSQQIGRQLNEALTTPGKKASDLDPALTGLAQQEQQDVDNAQKIAPPSALRNEHAAAIEALQFRVSGLKGLADTFRRTAGSKNTSNTGLLLAQQAQRLVASDVIWSDLVKAPSVAELNRQGVGGVAVPDSNFVTSTDFASPSYWVPIVQRLGGASTSSGNASGVLHGTGLVSVAALPSGKALDPNAENTVTATTDLGFAVTVEDTGDAQEVGVVVTLTIQQQPTPIVKTGKIDLINPGEQKKVIFHNLGQVQFATRTTVKVDVKPVPNEKRLDNNSASYKVIFSLG